MGAAAAASATAVPLGTPVVLDGTAPMASMSTQAQISTHAPSTGAAPVEQQRTRNIVPLANGSAIADGVCLVQSSACLLYSTPWSELKDPVQAARSASMLGRG